MTVSAVRYAAAVQVARHLAARLDARDAQLTAVDEAVTALLVALADVVDWEAPDIAAALERLSAALTDGADL